MADYKDTPVRQGHGFIADDHRLKMPVAIKTSSPLISPTFAARRLPHRSIRHAVTPRPLSDPSSQLLVSRLIGTLIALSLAVGSYWIPRHIAIGSIVILMALMQSLRSEGIALAQLLVSSGAL
jgi:hypothetical protein